MICKCVNKCVSLCRKIAFDTWGMEGFFLLIRFSFLFHSGISIFTNDRENKKNKYISIPIDISRMIFRSKIETRIKNTSLCIRTSIDIVFSSHQMNLYKIKFILFVVFLSSFSLSLSSRFHFLDSFYIDVRLFSISILHTTIWTISMISNLIWVWVDIKSILFSYRLLCSTWCCASNARYHIMTWCACMCGTVWKRDIKSSYCSFQTCSNHFFSRFFDFSSFFSTFFSLAFRFDSFYEDALEMSKSYSCLNLHSFFLRI